MILMQFCIDVKTPTVGSFFQGGIVLSYNDTTKKGLIISSKDLDSNLTWIEGKTVCDTSTLMGYDNWRMPTTEEMLLCYKVLHLNRKGNFNIITPYWGSREGKLGYFAWFVDFSNANAYPSTENNVAQIRAIRDFRL